MTQTRKRLLAKKARDLIPVIAFVLFVANYHICDLLYPSNSPEDIKNFWHTKNDIYSLVIALLFTYVTMSSKGKIRLLFDILTGLAVSNVVDRFFFEVRVWRDNDIIMIILTVIVSIYNYTAHVRRNKSTAK